MKNKNLLITLIIGFAIIFLVVIFFNKNKQNDILKCGPAGISYEEFEKIKTGDSQFKVDSIIDEDDLWYDDEIYNKCVIEISKDNQNHIYNYTYKYIGKNGGYALITYTADYSNGDLFVLPIVSKKEQFNLK